MTSKDTKAAWESFEADMKSVAGELRRHYKDADDERKTAELNRSLEQLGDAAEKFFESLDVASKDPEVRASTKRAARSFGSALRETFREVGDEIDKAFRDKPASK